RYWAWDTEINGEWSDQKPDRRRPADRGRDSDIILELGVWSNSTLQN
ncbi:hypothetical protein A2U01_0073147, partial [Trifolium medium]|nr:hypothetical protein [Trifolium medium]